MKYRKVRAGKRGTRALPITVPVAYTSYDLKSNADLGDNLGHVNHTKQRISIDKSVSNGGKFGVTFWHEWIHAVCYTGGYSQRGNSENFVEYFATALARMFADPDGRVIVQRLLKTMKPFNQKRSPHKAG